MRSYVSAAMDADDVSVKISTNDVISDANYESKWRAMVTANQNQQLSLIGDGNEPMEDPKKVNMTSQ